MGKYFRVFLIAIGLLNSCATPNIIFSTDKKATVSLVNFSDFTGDGQILGEAPQTINLDLLENKFVKVWGENLAPQFWVFNEIVGKETKVSLKMVEAKGAKDDPNNPDKNDEADGKPKSEDGKGNKKDDDTAKNLSYRILLQAYHALTVGDYDLSKELATKLRELQPKIAAPHVVLGIAHLQQGSKSDAASSFQVAKTLDPQDIEIDRLIEATR